MNAVADAYLDALCARLSSLKTEAADAIGQAAEAVAKAAHGDHLVYVFGTGHSHILAEEVHYRAGGLAFAVPILSSMTMLHEGAVASTSLERKEGVVAAVFENYPITADDVLFIVSNSGVNAAPMEAAQIGRDIGCTLVAITSVAYSTASAKGREKLADLADIVIDTGIPPGDAIIELPGTEIKAGPATTAVGAALINAIFCEVAHRLAQEGNAPVYLSANMPGSKEWNRELIARYRSRNRHL